MRQEVLTLQKKGPREPALAFLEQAEDFFSAAGRAQTSASKPLLLYYSFLNLAKALILVRKPGVQLDRAGHGLSEKLREGGSELTGAFLSVLQNVGNPAQVFDLLLQVSSGRSAPPKWTIDVPMLMRQIVTGHRLLAEVDALCGERFVSIERGDLIHDDKALTIWLRLAVARSDLQRIGATQAQLLLRSGLAPDWQVVKSPEDNERVLWIQQKTPETYRNTFIGTSIPKVIDHVRCNIWQTVTATPPYRGYYLLATPDAEQASRLPQLLSSYALFYYLGSITRYRPHHFDRIVDSPYGAFVQSFVHEQPTQMLFLFASEFAKRDVTKPSLA